jgi:hypothetical protein
MLRSLQSQVDNLTEECKEWCESFHAAAKRADDLQSQVERLRAEYTEQQELLTLDAQRNERLTQEQP